MQKKGRKGKKKKKRRNASVLKFFISLLFIIPTLFIAVLIWSRLEKTPPGPYEEIIHLSTDLDHRIREIDNAIYSGLYLFGLKEKDIFFLDVHPKHHNQDVWEFSEILAKCSDRQSALGLRKMISESLLKLDMGVRLRESRVGSEKKQVAFNIYSHEFHTHRLILSYKKIPERKGKKRPKIAIIIDDLGFDKSLAESFMNIDLPLTLSVLPGSPHKELILRQAEKKGFELLLHLPMEPKQYPEVDPGPDALLLSMNKNEILKALRHHLASLPGVKGVNNHMGSAFAENEAKMLVVLGELKKRNLFYIDSRTSSLTKGLTLARRLGLPSARRDVFLDNNLQKRILQRQMERLLSKARLTGAALGIAHPHKETVALIKTFIPKIEKDYDFVPASELIR